MRDRVETFRMSGVKKLAELRASGYDPTATIEARSKIGATNRAQSERRAKWERTHEQRPDPATFLAEVLPKIQQVPLRRLAEATGLSITHCAKIRAGLVVPHPMHWEPLHKVASPERGPSEEATMGVRFGACQ